MSQREVVLDTETTGFRPEEGHRLVEIGCVELINHVPTGKVYHTYCNPERDMPTGAFEVHGISGEFLRDKPLFRDVAEGFLAFIGDDRLVIHNSAFDLGFINAELERVGRPPVAPARAIDTVTMARTKFPGQPASLDALCRRFNVDLSVREKHGALTDARLLAEVYLGLIGGRQQGLSLANGGGDAASDGLAASDGGGRAARPPRPHAPSAEELAAHAAFMAKIKDPVWAA